MQRPVQVVYVHGFGGLREDQFGRPFAAFFSKHRRPLNDQFNLVYLTWRSEWRSLGQIAVDFQKARGEADRAAAELCARIQQFEQQGASYHLVGFSLGAEVIRRALQQQRAVLPRLRSIYFLGAAFNHDRPVNEAVIPTGARCHNYYSPQRDYVLKFSYRMAARGVPAAGEHGLTGSARFLNLPTRCAHKLLHNYSMLAAPIGFMISWDEGRLIDGRATVRPRPCATIGSQNWNHIAQYKGHVLQQQVRVRSHYRALREGPAGWVPVRGRNLHAILKLL